GGAQTAQIASFPPGQTQSLSYTARTDSSGIYVLSPATADFVWQVPNGTKIRYSITTEKPLISSSSGLWTQFTRTFSDLQPYSYLLLRSEEHTSELQSHLHLLCSLLL